MKVRFMEEKMLKSEVSFALEQVRHERRVIEAFVEDPTNENVASVTLEVSGVEHVILIHDEDAVELADLLLKFNDKERVRMCGSCAIRNGIGVLRNIARRVSLWLM